MTYSHGNMAYYVVCIVFDGPRDFVVLIEKKRPTWQVGLLNGPGGKIGSDETDQQAASRTFEKETGAHIKPESWTCFARLVGGPEKSPYAVSFLTVTRPCNIHTTSDESVGWYNMAGLNDLPLVPALRWIIPMAMDPNVPYAEVKDRVTPEPEDASQLPL